MILMLAPILSSFNEVKTSMHKTISQNSTSLFIPVKKFWYWKKSKKNKGIMQQFDMKVGHNVGKADE